METRLFNNKIINKRNVSIEFINDLISDARLHKAIEYNLYYPKEITKKVPANIKKAIDEIAFAESHASLIILKKIVDDFNQKFNDTLRLPNELSIMIGTLLNKTSYDIKVYENLLDAINSLQDLILSSLKKNSIRLSHEARQIAEQIAHIWLEGLYLHACIQIDRLKVQQLIFNSNALMTLTNHPVVEADMRIPVGHAEAINHIIIFEAEQSLPVILAILHELVVIIAEKPELSSNCEPINFAIKLLSDANEKLYTSMSEMPAVLGKLKNEMIPNLSVLVEKLSDCKLNEAVLAHTNELLVWLDGLYAHTFNPPSRGFLERAKEAAKKQAFKAATGLSEKEIAVYYHHGANGLRCCLDDFEKQKIANLDILKDRHQDQMINSDIAVHSEVKDNIPDAPQLITLKLSNDLELSIKTSNAALARQIQSIETIRLLKNFFTDQANLPVKTQCNNLAQEKVNQDELEFWSLLQEAKNSANQVKIDTLLNAVRRLDLSLSQKNRLLYLKKKTAASLEGYKNDTYLKEYLRSLSSVIFPRANADVASSILNNLTRPSFDDAPEDPKIILLELYKARAKLIEKKKSHTLLPCIEMLLLEAYIHLLNKTPQLREEEGHKCKQPEAELPSLNLFSSQHPTVARSRR